MALGDRSFRPMAKAQRLLLKSLEISPEVNVSRTLQISIGWLYVVTSVIPLALKGILPIGIIPIGKIPLSAKGITDVTTYKHHIDIYSVF